jgi:hypothetical protein
MWCSALSMAVNGTCKQVFNNQLSRKKQFKKKKPKQLYTEVRSYVCVISTKKSDSSDIPWSKINRY